ncbi:MAG: lipoyl synthase [Desulfobacteraceae bacterium]|nr:lipoyl synthase [Desulfobacteraceae bacterium]
MAIGNNKNHLEVMDWGLLDYGDALDRQRCRVAERIAGDADDCLILVEHPSVVTFGKTANHDDLRLAETELKKNGVALFYVERGGRATCHGPGQLVLYPIIALPKLDVHWFVQTFLKAMARVLSSYGLVAEFKDESPGLWVHGKKIASIGVSIKKQVTFHGLALNVNNDLSLFHAIVPCGHSGEVMTSIAGETGVAVSMLEVKERAAQAFAEHFGYHINQKHRHPQWLKLPSPESKTGKEIEKLLNALKLSTVCQSAHCPNIGECFGRGTATFMILGNRCTRNCRFCAVENAPPVPPDPDEPARIAQAVQRLGLRYVVITSVTRDDLPDGGAGHFAETIEAVRHTCPGVEVEVLIPDFKGDVQALHRVCEARPDRFNHNIETVPRLYGTVRPGAIFQRSLDVLRFGFSAGLPVKSGLMLGLGETEKEITDTLYQLLLAGCQFLTIGQYLSPSPEHLPVVRYVPPEEFTHWAEKAKIIGFTDVAAGPLVRSSYKAEEMGSRTNKVFAS